MAKLMHSLNFGLAVGGLIVTAFMLRELFVILGRGSVPRRSGNDPIRRDRQATLFWTFVGWCSLCTLGIMWGTLILVIRLLSPSQ